jgi:hypothetical protein
MPRSRTIDGRTALRDALTGFIAENSVQADVLYRELDFFEQLGALEKHGGCDFELIKTLLGSAIRLETPLGRTYRPYAQGHWFGRGVGTSRDAGHRPSGAGVARRSRRAGGAGVRVGAWCRRARRAFLASEARLACSCASSSRIWPRDWMVV